jgi:hypothetical protein
MKAITLKDVSNIQPSKRKKYIWLEFSPSMETKGGKGVR